MEKTVRELKEDDLVDVGGYMMRRDIAKHYEWGDLTERSIEAMNKAYNNENKD